MGFAELGCSATAQNQEGARNRPCLLGTLLNWAASVLAQVPGVVCSFPRPAQMHKKGLWKDMRDCFHQVLSVGRGFLLDSPGCGSRGSRAARLALALSNRNERAPQEAW